MKSYLKLIGVLIYTFALANTAGAEPAAQPKYIDGDVTAQQIQAKLQAEGFSPVTKISVQAQDGGVVTLKGVAVSEAEATRAVDIAKEASGVTGVQSEIYIKRIQ